MALYIDVGSIRKISEKLPSVGLSFPVQQEQRRLANLKELGQ